MNEERIRRRQGREWDVEVFEVLWTDYVCADDSELTAGARRLKCALLEIVKPARADDLPGSEPAQARTTDNNTKVVPEPTPEERRKEVYPFLEPDPSISLTPAEDREFVKAVREWVKAAEECGVGWYWKRPGTARHRRYRTAFAKVKSLLPAEEAASDQAHTVEYPQCEGCASRETTFYQGFGWLCEECKAREYWRVHPNSGPDSGPAVKPNLREAAELVERIYYNMCSTAPEIRAPLERQFDAAIQALRDVLKATDPKRSTPDKED